MQQRQLRMKSMMSSDQDWKLLHNALTQNTYDIGIRAFEELTAEYSNLRAGIVETDERAIQISNFVIIFTGALAGFATSQLFFASQSQADYLVKTTLFIFMEIFAFIGLAQLIDRFAWTFVITSYIKTFIEPQTRNIKWETRLKIYREDDKKALKGKEPGFFIYQRLTFFIIIITDYFAASTYFWHSNTLSSQIRAIFIFIGFLLTVVAYVIMWRKVNKLNSDNTKWYDKRWESVKQREL